ncbi:hypothetical protein FQN55_006355 [Onygenales sp. PD_40]|nr:hypothetical protein FQN55_006355 [Onygenales sp. PD_40]
MLSTPKDAPNMLPPLNVEQIARLASEFEFDALTPLRYWLRSAASLVKEASIYEREGNDQQAYLLLFRHAQLVLAHIATHPEARDEDSRRAVAAAKREVQTSLSKLEELKPRINKRYERYSQLIRDREARKVSPFPANNAFFPAKAPIDPALAGVSQPLEAAENKELAVKLARREFNRRATAQRGAQLSGRYGYDGKELRHQTDDKAGDDLSLRLQEIRSKVVPTAQKEVSSPRRRASTPHGQPLKKTAPEIPSDYRGTRYKYPSVPRQQAFDASPPPPPVPSKEEPFPQKISSSPLPPALPAKIQEPILPSLDLLGPSPPPIPSKISSVPPPEINGIPTPEIPTPPLEPQPSSYTFKPSAYLENGTPLRTIFISPDLRKHFLKLASPNTYRNLETCGILCGTLLSNAFFISKLVIPEQESTSDTCEMINESAIFDYCDSEDLMVLGWIHTHPSQTCFMSSRDLHTQSGYQVMLAESIAIVCAPSKDPDWGVFRLTDPPGLKCVLGCTQPGIFHPHDESNIYTDALRPGHVFEAEGMEFEVVDLRDSK